MKGFILIVVFPGRGIYKILGQVYLCCCRLVKTITQKVFDRFFKTLLRHCMGDNLDLIKTDHDKTEAL